MNTVDMNVCPVNSPILSLKNPATHSKGLDLLGATQLPSLQNHPKQVDQIIMAKQAGGPKGGEGQRDDDWVPLTPSTGAKKAPVHGSCRGVAQIREHAVRTGSYTEKHQEKKTTGSTVLNTRAQFAWR